MFHQQLHHTAEVQLFSDLFKGQRQWYATSVPTPWRLNRHGEVRTVVVNLPNDSEPLEGERWLIRRINEIPGITFANGLKKLANPEGVPEEFVGGQEVVVSETPENDGCLVRHVGRVKAVEYQRLSGLPDNLKVEFHDLRHELIRRKSGALLPQHADQSLQLHGLHRIGGALHAYQGKRLVMVSRP